MSPWEVFGRATRHADLIEQMVEATGTGDALGNLHDAAAVKRRAHTRCMTCGAPDRCEAWLGQATTGDEAPSFCRNHDLLERLRRATREHQ